MPNASSDDDTHRNAEAIKAALRHLSDCDGVRDDRPFLKRALVEIQKITTGDDYSAEKKRRAIMKFQSALTFKTGKKQQEVLGYIAGDIERISSV